MAETARNKLRYPVKADTPDVPRDIENLAKDIDVKMVSWWEGTHAARPAAGQPNRIYKETDTNRLFHDTGAAWEAIVGPGITVGPGYNVKALPFEVTAGERPLSFLGSLAIAKSGEFGRVVIKLNGTNVQAVAGNSTGGNEPVIPISIVVPAGATLKIEATNPLGIQNFSGNVQEL